MNFYAIRRESDGAFMPQGRGRGFTVDEPTSNKPPRLFTTKHAADVALTWWRRGITTVSHTPDIFEGGSEEDWRTEEIAGRDAADLRVVSVSLEVTPLTPLDPARQAK
jgi:hypothetical protein